MFATLYTSLLTTLLAAVSSITSTMTSSLAAPMAGASLLYIVFYGVAILRGTVALSGVDFGFQALKLGIINALVTSFPHYASWVNQLLVVDLSLWINSLTGSVTSFPADQVLISAAQFAEQIKIDYAGASYAAQIYAGFLSIVLYGCAIIFMAIAFIITLVAQFGLAFMAAIGPLFIAFALFDVSRGWFFSWLGQILNFAILQLLVTILALIAVAFFGEVVTKANTLLGVQAIVVCCVALVVLTIFFFLIPSMAAALTGGAQASTGLAQRGFERSVMRRKSGNNREDKASKRNGSVAKD